MHITFIGCGNMGGAMMQGILDSGICRAEDITAADKSDALLQKRKEELKVNVTGDNRAAAKEADILFLSVKPQFYETVIEEIKNSVRDDTLVVTIAPGKTLAWTGEKFGKDLKIVRMMPNTPAMVKEGMIGMCGNALVSDEDMENIRKICSGFAKTEVIAENLMDVVTAVSGSSPAYVFMFIEAMADAAVAGGMPRDKAYTFAAQAVLGSAKMVLETGKHPGELKDMVCSPAGTTIQAVRVLEEKGFRSAVIECMEKCLEISRGL
ncbi:MAG: pyrroline-5-carboxylate reductase [Lachnospiraceae bacterium]|nr:pyrroline-5-carboxylate reductase [Lachnospiraceae bacterium]